MHLVAVAVAVAVQIVDGAFELAQSLRLTRIETAPVLTPEIDRVVKSTAFFR